MSKLKPPSDCKTMLAESTNHRRSSGIFRSSVCSIPIPLASMTKSQTANRLMDMEELDIRPEYQSISCELRALAKMVEHEFGNCELGNTDFPDTFNANSSSLFERGRFYDEYSARRNERLKGKKAGERREDDRRRSVCNLGVNVESVKKRDLKKYGSLRKSVPANFSIGGRTENHRYSLRVRNNAKGNENKKPSMPITPARSVVDGVRKVGAAGVLKI
ncbi:uncharacterized protein LOC122662207 [Telopea speciosissima]|uniref:uncharacterized protein LOC122662207 n=1 Tax=Telopea speciosissima TaxID=54955 RepID=UPI001CC55867|nr:uncharacterized protein LOC122662207 [Telopea speciosissima]